MKATDIALILWYIVAASAMAYMAYNMFVSTRRNKKDSEESNRRMEEIHRLHVKAMNLTIDKMQREARDPGRPWE